MNHTTIFALSSGAGRAGIAVIRLSGPRAGEALMTLTLMKTLKARHAVRASIYHPDNNEIIDQGLVLWFPSPDSFTGEDVAEFHVHGGHSVVVGILGALAKFDDLRMAEPGEFTRRAFENGKFDLTAAEGVADLINAETEAQRRQAVRQMQGELGHLYEDWRCRLVSAAANIEAGIDFSDEDIPRDLVKRTDTVIQGLINEITDHLADGRRGERLRDGLRVAIIGAPNAGKSSLLNLLTRRSVAIVSEIEGTTRDVIETPLDIGGYPIVIADTAGLREGRDEVEREGVQRARLRAEDSDLKLAVFDGGKSFDDQTLQMIDGDTLVVINKIDLGVTGNSIDFHGTTVVAISVRTGEGVDVFMSELVKEIAKRCELSSSPSLTQARHRQALEECLQSLNRFRKSEASELLAEDLRLAARSLGRITGRVGVEDILDVIFHNFCIGK